MSTRRIIFPTLVVALSIAIGLLFCELLVRLVVPRSRWEFRDGTADWNADRELGWVNKPNLSSTLYKGEFNWTVTFQTNADGILPALASRSKSPGTVRVMIFGDSTVVGRIVPDEFRIHRQLERLLGATLPRVEVLNAGVEGYSTDQELLLMRRLIPVYRPDIVLNSVCGNDFHANLNGSYFGMSKPRFLIQDRSIAGFLPPDPRTLQIREIPTTPFRAVLRKLAVYRLFVPQIFSLRARFGDLKGERGSVISDVYYNRQTAGKLPFDVFEALLKSMKALCKQYGAAFYLYGHPDLAEVWEPYVAAFERENHLRHDSYDRYAVERKVQAAAAGNGIVFCPLIDYFLDNRSRGPFHLLPRDPHCNPTGYEVTAQALVRCLTPAAVAPK